MRYLYQDPLMETLRQSIGHLLFIEVIHTYRYMQLVNSLRILLVVFLLLRSVSERALRLYIFTSCHVTMLYIQFNMYCEQPQKG